MIIKVFLSVVFGIFRKKTAFWVVVPCSLVEVYQRFVSPCCLHHQDDDRPDDGGSRKLWYVGELLLDYTAPKTQETAIFILTAVRTSNRSQASLSLYRPQNYLLSAFLVFL
jgi:hypothetical protein